jgi:transcriptional regulator with XRE-family HTH domain
MTLCEKLSRLAAQNGWGEVALADRAGINRGTARDILNGSKGQLRPDTIQKIAGAFKLSVADLKRLPLDDLVAHVRGPAVPVASSADLLDALRAAQPKLADWLEDHPEDAARLMPWEFEELKSIAGVGGPMTYDGAGHFVGLIFRKREAVGLLTTVAGTEMFDLIVDILRAAAARAQPYRDRK